MLQVLPVEDKELQREYCETVGVEYDADQICYAAYDNGELRGISLFRIIDKYCVIFRIKLADGVSDHLAEYLLAKAPMNLCDRCGIKKAVFKDKNEALAKELEFIEKDGIYTLDLEGYFTTPCHSREKNKHG